jgi:hypothetical protein
LLQSEDQGMGAVSARPFSRNLGEEFLSDWLSKEGSG